MEEREEKLCLVTMAAIAVMSTGVGGWAGYELGRRVSHENSGGRQTVMMDDVHEGSVAMENKMRSGVKYERLWSDGGPCQMLKGSTADIRERCDGGRYK